MILIDEVDLHLHASWQRVVVGRLSQAFPTVQLILTTHSPLVIGGLSKDSVRILHDFQVIPDTPHTEGRDASSILYEIMGIPRWPEQTQRDIETISALADTGRMAEARATLDQLADRLGPDDPEVVRLRTFLAFLNGE